MSWRGFTAESKSFCGYPGCGRWRFWRDYPLAWLIFQWLCARDWFRAVLRFHANPPK